MHKWINNDRMADRYTLNWNERRCVFLANVKRLDGIWSSKTLPRKIVHEGQLYELTRSDEAIAARWLENWIDEFDRSNDKTVFPNEIAKNDLRFLAPRWLQLRYDDPYTAPNTFNGFKLSVNNWILDGKFRHHSIQNLDVEKELTVAELTAWIRSLKGAESSKIQHINTLRAMLNDCIEQEWISPEASNPLDKPAIRRLYRQLQQAESEKRVITHLSTDQIHALLTGKHKFVSDYRKLRYLSVLSWGGRESEVEGLVWSDLGWLSKGQLRCLDGSLARWANEDEDQLRGIEEGAFVNIVRQLVKAGRKPFLVYEDIREKYNKSQFLRLPNAIVQAPKRNSKRVLPIHPLLSEALKWWWRIGWRIYTGKKPQRDDPVFPRQNKSLREGQNAGDFCVSDAAILFQSDLRRLGMRTDQGGRELTFHSLRHTFSFLCELAGAEDTKIEQLLGHNAGSVLRSHYLKSAQANKELVEKFQLPKTLTLSSRVIGESVKLHVVKNTAASS